MEEKIALVLAGGGAKGSYQVGAIKALQELNIKFDIVTGTSIGALNGCMVAQKTLDELYDLWKNLTVDKVIDGTVDLSFNFNDLINNTNLYGELLKNYIDEKGVNIDPLINTIKKLYNSDKLKDSEIDFGCVTVEYPSLKYLYVDKNMMMEKGVDYLIASASCFPAFPIHNIEDKSFIDGGYYDNLPINLALSMNATRFVVVDLSEDVYHKNFLNRENVVYIYPRTNIGSFLDFNKETLNRNFKLGYNDTMKKFNIYKGYKYTFKKFDVPSFMQEMYLHMLKMESSIGITNKKDNSNITDYFLKSINKQILTKEDLFFAVLDEIFTLLKKDVEKVYTFDDISVILLEEFKDGFKEDYDILPSSILKLKEYLSTLDRVGMICRFINTEIYPDKKLIDNNILIMISSIDLFLSKFVIKMIEHVIK